MIRSDQVFGRGTGPTYAISQLQCSGAEASLAECGDITSSLDQGECFDEVIGVVCEGENKLASVCTQMYKILKCTYKLTFIH